MSVFTRDGDLLVPTGHARGPWDENAMHGGAPSAAIVRAVERVAPGMRLTRLTVEFLGAVPLVPVSVEAEVVKPGKRFQVVEARLSAGGREAAWARAALMRHEPTDGLPANAPARALPDPGTLERGTVGSLHGEGFGTTTMELRFVEGSFEATGPAVVWFRLDHPLVEGEQPSPAQRAIAAADFGNGVSRVLDWNEWLFVNTDLSMHLHREPEGEWIGVEAETILQPNGSGLATTTLHDVHGRVGVGTQTLFVARRPE